MKMSLQQTGSVDNGITCRLDYTAIPDVGEVAAHARR